MIKALALVLLLAFSAHAETFTGPFPVKVTKVLDGDTVRVEIRLWFSQVLTETIRIEGIDAPELKAKCASEAEGAERAKTRLTELLSSGHAEVWNVRREKYGRALGTITAQGMNVGDTMLKEGLVRPYAGGRRQGWC